MTTLDEKRDIETGVNKANIEGGNSSDDSSRTREDHVVVNKNDPPLDGGFRAWIQVLGAALLWFNLWGYTFAFGSFQNYYVNDYLRGTSSSTIAWIGSIQVFLLISSGLYAGPLFDLGFCRTMMYAGAFLSTFGSMILSLSTKYYQIFLTQGVCVGLGCGVLFVPCMALVARSFEKRRAVAIALMSCGAPIGSIIYTFIFEQLLPKVGFAWTARAMGFFMLACYALAFPLMFWGATNTGMVGSGTRRKLIDWAALTDLPFWSYTLATSTQYMAYLIPFFFMPTYAQSALGSSIQSASYVLVVSQAGSVPGRLFPAVVANYTGSIIPWAFCACMSGVMCLTWISVKDLAGFTVFAAFYGFFSGALIPLPASVFPKVVPDPRVLGTRLGMAQGISSIAQVIGPPIAGALLRANTKNSSSSSSSSSSTTNSEAGSNWLAVQLFTGILLLFAMLQVFGLWTLLIRKRGTKVLV